MVAGVLIWPCLWETTAEQDEKTMMMGDYCPGNPLWLGGLNYIQEWSVAIVASLRRPCAVHIDIRGRRA